MKGIRFTLGVAVASSQRKRDSVCVGSKHRVTAVEKVLVRSIPIFLVLRDSLATAVITYKDKDKLTRENQPFSQEPATSHQWMLFSNDPSIYP